MNEATSALSARLFPAAGTAADDAVIPVASCTSASRPSPFACSLQVSRLTSCHSVGSTSGRDTTPGWSILLRHQGEAKAARDQRQRPIVQRAFERDFAVDPILPADKLFLQLAH